MDCTEIRQKFVTYYKTKGFRLIPPLPLVQKNLPMSYVFSCTPPEPDTDADKFVRTQTCFRHFDVDAAGKDRLHLSLFEMSGAFRFGSEKREKTIARIWQWAVQVMGINPERIWVSYFRGGRVGFGADSPTENTHGFLELPEDRELFQAWHQVGVPESRIAGLDAGHNYWVEKTQNKDISLKCGPISEMFYDLGKDRACGKNCLPGCQCGRFIEFCNNRFISDTFNPKKGRMEKTETALAESVLGVERTAMIVQNVPCVSEIKSRQTLHKKIHAFATCKNMDDAFVKECEHVIADHLKALCILLAEGAPEPGRSGRARIMRTLIRKMLTRKMLLGIDADDFFPVMLAELIPNDTQEKSLKEKILLCLEKETEKFADTLKKV